MRHFASDSAESYAVGVVDVARWEQYGLQDTLPFQAMWYTVPPRSSSPQDCHPEVELSIVVRGAASVETAGVITDVPQGEAFLLDGSEAHIIHNRSDDEPLLVFTTFWMPRTDSASAVPSEAAADSVPAVTA
jgi:mannose-6-phosphate isomerase-like protein (cupin superfamily)